MVIPLPPARDDEPPRRVSSAVALLLVLALAIGIWLLNGRSPGTPTGAPVESEPGRFETFVVDVVDLESLPAAAQNVFERVRGAATFPAGRGPRPLETAPRELPPLKGRSAVSVVEDGRVIGFIVDPTSYDDTYYWVRGDAVDAIG